MLLYDSYGPNPHTTRLFVVERGCEVNIQPIDIEKYEHRRKPYIDINPRAELPALILDDGTVITEITAICQYLDKVTPGKSLFGDEDPKERAIIHMWYRRIYLNILMPAIEWWRGSTDAENSYTGNRILIPEGQRGFRAMAEKGLNQLELDLADEREFITGDSYSMADLMFFAFVNEMKLAIPWFINPGRPYIAAWYERILARPASQKAIQPLPAGSYKG
ncbi:glutathione S-transferase family protein [Paenibacillus peoriae]|uniref:glutathione S-transferase family protein n=1 Tax=Paenibacillus peoriae TaxID=59893 RepID=UPI00026C5F4D|nr:glutathione S-transferase family protein [Paenibacillus peoriae]MEC0180638.1 glutathione S-transferase family protein [Paenibacillus peoriae]